MKTLALLFAAFAGAAFSTLAADEPKPLPLGAPAPDFSLPGVDGKTYSLKDFAASPILVVVFTCNHCPTAQYYEDRLKRIVTDYRDRGVAVVAISPNDPEAVRPDELGYADLGDSLADMKIRARDHAFNFPYLFGGGEFEAASRAYGPTATPHVFVFDAARKLRYVGRIDDSERERFVRTQDLRKALDALLAGQEPPVTQTRVFGCSTKWSSKRDGVKQYWERIAAEPVTVQPATPEDLRALRMNESAKNDAAKLRLVNFWATWCGPCVTEFPDLMQINRMYRQRDFELITVAAHFTDEQAEVLRFLKKHQASNRNLLFAGSPAAGRDPFMEAFDAEWSGALPFTVLIDPAGEILYRKEGAIDALELKRVILKHLNARKPW
ncbi:MAG: redoxin domain-containing protein [Verrucomicrobia bacterium]|nr:redoxin domain-containing protein [Verrucomicrobiota bacterium]